VPDVIVVIPSAQERHALPTRMMMMMRRRIVDIFMNCGYQKMQIEIIL